MIALLLMAAAAPAADAAQPASIQGLSRTEPCAPTAPGEVVVCARQKPDYRIDRNVLEASRALDAPTPRPPLHPEVPGDDGCVGGKTCTGNFIPLVGMGLTVARAAALAARGDDWRDAIRIHEDEYRLYKAAEARRARDRRPHIGFSVGH